MAAGWDGRTRGTHWMQRALVGIIRAVGVRPIYWVMHLWLVWYCLVRGSERRSSYQFHRMRGRNRVQAIVDVYRSFYHFGKAIVDRFAVYSGHSFDVEVENWNLYLDKVKGKDSVVLLFSHLGNSEMAAYTMNTAEKKMNILLFGGESAVVLSNRAKVLNENKAGMIIVNPGEMDHIYAVNEALLRGEVLAIAGDRNMGSKTISCRFMGKESPLPAGVFQLCVTSKCPILLTFVIKEGVNAYHIYTEELHPNAALSRMERAQDLAQQFAGRLEQMAYQYPYEWFNFYNFWK